MGKRTNLWISDERKRVLVERKLLQARARFRDGDSAKNTARAMGVLQGDSQLVCGLLKLDDGDTIEHYWLRWRGVDVDVTPMDGDCKSGKRSVVKVLDALSLMTWIGTHGGKFPRIIDFPQEYDLVLQQCDLSVATRTTEPSAPSKSAHSGAVVPQTEPKPCLKCLHAAMSDRERLTTRRLHCTALADIRVSPTGSCYRWQSRSESPLPLPDLSGVVSNITFDIRN
jgi:hypothetical protein